MRALLAMMTLTACCAPAPPKTCTATDCGVDGECRDGKCVPLGSVTDDAGTPACTVDDDCAPGSVCRADGCKAVSCGDACSCTSAEACENGSCAPPPPQCHSSSDCPCELSCNGFINQCFSPNGACNVDADCAALPGCDAGRCRCSGGSCVLR